MPDCPICAAPHGFHETNCGSSVPVPPESLVVKVKVERPRLTDEEIAVRRAEAAAGGNDA